MTDETPTPEADDTEAHRMHFFEPVEDVEAHGQLKNANEPVDEDVEAHTRMMGNANEPTDEDAEAHGFRHAEPAEDAEDVEAHGRRSPGGDPATEAEKGDA